MTAASDLHAHALAAIAERRAKVEAGTPGPWRLAEVPGANEVWANRDPAGHHAFMVASTATRLNPNPGIRGYDDVRLIVAAVNDYEPLLRLAEMVLERHAPGVHPEVLCEHCDMQGRFVEWPCPDAQAALTALGVHDG